jgi:hypothetical protein
MPLKTVKINKKHSSVSLGHKKNFCTCTIGDAVQQKTVRNREKTSAI